MMRKYRTFAICDNRASSFAETLATPRDFRFGFEPDPSGRHASSAAGRHTMTSFNHGHPQLVVPDTVQAGTKFTVAVTTYGNGCYRKGETEVAASGSVVTITPRDYVDLGASACPDASTRGNRPVVAGYAGIP